MHAGDAFTKITACARLSTFNNLPATLSPAMALEVYLEPSLPR